MWILWLFKTIRLFYSPKSAHRQCHSQEGRKEDDDICLFSFWNARRLLKVVFLFFYKMLVFRFFIFIFKYSDT